MIVSSVHERPANWGRPVRASHCLRSAIAVVCMLLAFVLSCQAYISLMDRIEHSHHHVHFANPLAGDVQFCGGDHDGCGLHHQHHSHVPGLPHDHSDHQHGDAAIVFLVVQNFVVPGSPAISPRCELEPSGLSGISRSGLERPPKRLLEFRV